MEISIIYRKCMLNIKTVEEHIMSFKKYSKNKIEYIDQYEFNKIYNINSDCVVLHYTIMHSIAIGMTKFINIVNKYNINENINLSNSDIEEIDPINPDVNGYNANFFHLTNFLLNYSGTIIAFIQDEYYDTTEIINFLELINVDIVYTCIPSISIPKIYHRLTETIFFNNLTGYVPELDFHLPDVKHRQCEVFYRGRSLPYYYGDLGQDKSNIGKYMKMYCDKYNIINDIDWKGENCVYGDLWYSMLANSKTTLATESGSNIFDVDGELKKNINIWLGLHPNQCAFPEDPIYSYVETKIKFDFKKYEIEQGQVSPKMFESIKLKTVLIMFEGNYSGILKPNLHFIELKKDFSNIEDVIKKIKDVDYLTKIAENAFNDIILSNIYSYKNFIKTFDDNLNVAPVFKPNYLSKNKNFTINWINKIYHTIKCDILLMRAEYYGCDPRRDFWYESCAPQNINIHQICFYNQQNKYKKTLNNNKIYYIYDYNLQEEISTFRCYYHSLNNEYLCLNSLINLIMHCIDNIGISYSHQLSWYMTHIFCVAKYIIDYFRNNNLNNMIKCIIINNLPTLVAGTIIKLIYDIPLIYDCLEYSPESQETFTNIDSSTLEEFEKNILNLISINYYYTVSPPLASFLKNKYNKNFNYLPNCVPKKLTIIDNNKYINQRELILSNFSKTQCKFLFQGGIGRSRGIDKLIKIWDKTDEKAILFIRGPYYDYVDELIKMAKEKNLLNNRIYFLNSINVNFLLCGIYLDCDVGLIPYPNINYNQKYCSPNKFGEYISMGKPILANKTEYVEKIIIDNDLGKVVDFNDYDMLINEINTLTNDIKLREKYKYNCLSFYKREFNWDKQSIQFYKNISEVVELCKHK